ncbi:MAG: hypothetical protein A3D44_00925 [Candidatus Staskawiczbacteria bacterium RIFCSPHIGHO2_02_FULL_42_22]|uniref:DUF2283 domain-containing protein n=1 Tax=Candidatus Staskawiczbacteria bacterium RIFCSPHIGHO2_02_FULL_42_22 TaxID=1802207 RepID=A0A1G2I3A5_9BACT|nr:MAG: hypothetical protein A3D44_00925 [Candidatus Staskawiczbacteria bacterium RIFCSPHIGHO2_02_FULL_42_22]
MKITYDSKYNIAYLSLKDKGQKNVTAIRLSDEVNIDIAPDGGIYGIELLNAKKQLKGDKNHLFLTVSDAISKKTVRVPLAAR